MPTVTINVADAGTPTSNGSNSLVGHMWYSLNDGSGHTDSYGFEPARDFRRLQLLRGWSHDQASEVFPASAGACGADGAGAPGIAGKIGCTAETLRLWVRRTERDQGLRPGLTTDERARMKALEREVRELRQANEILRKASAYFAQAELDRRFTP
mgnify:CR=1 FL=1